MAHSNNNTKTMETKKIRQLTYHLQFANPYNSYPILGTLGETQIFTAFWKAKSGVVVLSDPRGKVDPLWRSYYRKPCFLDSI